MVGHFCTSQVFHECTEQSIEFYGIEGSGVSAARETFIDKMIEGDYTHLLMIDEDMMFPRDGLHQLLRRRQHLVGANYRKRVPPGDWLAISADRKGRVETTADKTGLESVNYTGFGFFLLSREALEKVKAPRFLLRWVEETNGYTTEDAVFFEKAHEAGLDVYIDHDLSKQIAHLGQMDYRFDGDYASNPTFLMSKDIADTEKVERNQRTDQRLRAI